MYPSDLVKLKHGPEVWMTVETVDEQSSTVTTVWLDSDGRLQRSPNLPEDALDRRKDDEAPKGWVWRGQLAGGHAFPVRAGRNVRLVTFPHQTDENAIEMTVTGAKDRQVAVVWFNKQGEMNQATLPLELFYFRREQ